MNLFIKLHNHHLHQNLLFHESLKHYVIILMLFLKYLVINQVNLKLLIKTFLDFFLMHLIYFMSMLHNYLNDYLIYFLNALP